MLFRALLATLAAATVVFGAAVDVDTEPAQFNPTAKPLATPIYDDVADVPLTNAERLRQGLGPLPPKMKRFGFGIHAPGPVRPPPSEPSAAVPQPSGGPITDPPIVFEGIVQVTDAKTGQVIGYVSEKMSRQGQLRVDRNYRTPLEVSFTTTRANQQPGSIKITHGDSRSGKYFGAVASQWMHGGRMNNEKNAFAYLARTAQTKPGVGPMSVANSIFSMLGMRLKAESTIWTAQQFTGELSSSWTNTGGKTIDTTIFYYKSANALALSGNPDAFMKAHRDAVEVKLTIINKPFY